MTQIDTSGWTRGAMLAPMAGITDRVFRRLCRRKGSVRATTEMVSAKGLYYSAASTRTLLARDADEQALSVQLFGHEEDVLAYAVAQVNDLPFDAIDINMGCPAPKVTRQGDGSALMLDLPRAARVIDTVVRISKKPVSVKFRSGWDDAHLCAVDFARMAEEHGAAFVCVHPRTRAQQYAGHANWETIAAVKQAVRIPVIGSGDVRSGKDALDMLQETRCDGVMIGRAALGNPWIFEEVRACLAGAPYAPPSVAQRLEMARTHALMLVRELPERVAILQMRKHVAWYMHGMPGAAALRQQVNACATLEQLLAYLDACAAHA
nr:tRNA dihydrouridine synthase DusB [Maliibacterium massiliense]